MAETVAHLTAEILARCGQCNEMLDIEDMDGDLTDLECTLANHEEVLTGVNNLICWNCQAINRIPTLLEVVQPEKTDGDALQEIR